MYNICTRTLRSFIDERSVLEKFNAWKAMGVEHGVAGVMDSILIDCLGVIFTGNGLQIHILGDNIRLWKHSEVDKGESVRSKGVGEVQTYLVILAWHLNNSLLQSQALPCFLSFKSLVLSHMKRSSKRLALVSWWSRQSHEVLKGYDWADIRGIGKWSLHVFLYEFMWNPCNHCVQNGTISQCTYSDSEKEKLFLIKLMKMWSWSLIQLKNNESLWVWVCEYVCEWVSEWVAKRWKTHR